MIYKQKLANGLNVLIVPNKNTKAITAMVLLPVGSRFEEEEISGASHFVEHMLFKGTSKRATYLDISKELDSYGAEYNAFTSKDYTGYYIKIASAKQELAYDVLSDIIFNSSFDKNEVKKEKGVIIEELKMYDDNPTMKIDSLFESLIFSGHQLGVDIGGTKKTVKNISREKLYNYYKKYYVPSNMILVLAGNIDIKKKQSYLKYFNLNKNNYNKQLNKNFKKFSFEKSELKLEQRIKVQTKKLDQVHMILGFPGISYLSSEKFALSVLLSILSGGMSSRLFVEVREKRGLAYMIRASADYFLDTGIVFVQAGLDPNRLKEAVLVIKEELKKIYQIDILSEELENAKNNLIGRLSLSLEDSSEVANWYAKKFWFSNNLDTPDDIIKQIKKVKANEVKKIAKKLFDFNKIRLAAIGPIKKQDIIKMLS